ncbi:uncharacterized protein BP5553_07415 [Venustampulla echinocandica]|uniref:leucine--tRNA ligase n=1 Tax=Venustampulla echinocandica TaxID=2656787 RepID=A0A370TJE6_9HELO|nr:uncharacterized protein BP5553_07415 [Venustampulla echinocandica]RDL35484.1 hypothetical protein BP5553_07415 [Venustampulla echinocandica]
MHFIGSHAGRRLARPSYQRLLDRRSRPTSLVWRSHASGPAISRNTVNNLDNGAQGAQVLASAGKEELDSGTSVKVNRPLTGSPRETPLDLPSLDKKWRKKWKEMGPRKRTVDKTDPQKSMYILPMFPYPSGDLHLGHLRVYTISDVLARFKHMQGYDVMHPIGWDAFGLPAENAAIERGIDPASWTKLNIERMRGRLEAMNGHWDWHREFATCDPSFYKHTQRLFLLLHERGLAYQAESLVNYDPVDKTVLANEQVDAKGHSWRSGAKVEKRLLNQWFFKISAFRQELLDDIEQLATDGAWPEGVLAMQKNWIGKSQGARIKFPVTASHQQTHSDIEVFTTRPDTLFGVQYLALASTHPIVQKLAKYNVGLQAFLDAIPALPLDSRVGYLLPDIRAINPLAYEKSTPDATKASLPIYVAPYVLGDYGDGAVMGVPGHDTRDHAFWKHNRYDDPIRMVIAPSPDDASIAGENQPFVHHGHLTSHGGPYAGYTTAAASKEIVSSLELKGLGIATEAWRLRDWLVSRQRYWGTPIPIIHCKGCGPVPVPHEQLPVELPALDGHWGKGKTGNPLDNAHDWVNTACPKCGDPARRDTDTMDTFVDSSWYFMRFPDPHNDSIPFSPEAVDSSLPIDIYVGGVEHAILHLLYARFISKFFATTPYWPSGSKTRGEPFKRVLAQGMVHGKTYSDPSTGRFLKQEEVDLSQTSNPIIIATGETPNISYEKMSKSKYNGVDPGICMDKHGADATRAHILFQAPVNEVLEWEEERISGVVRWLRRIYDHISHSQKRWAPEMHDASSKSNLVMFENAFKLMDFQDPLRTEDAELRFLHERSDSTKKLWRGVQRTIIDVTESYNNGYSLNTVVSDLMSLTNTIIDTSKGQEVPRGLIYASIASLLKMIAPIAPAFAEECWTMIPGSTSSIFEQPFPEPDGTYDTLAPRTQPCSVQVNGKLKCVVELPVPDPKLKGDGLEGWIVGQILGTAEGKARLMGSEGKKGAVDIRTAKKVIVVRGGKTINFVV